MMHPIGSCLNPAGQSLLEFNRWPRLSFSAGLSVGLAFLLSAQFAVADDKLEYNRDIRPILAENCFSCHGADSAARQADLRLDLRDAAIEMGAITEGQPEDSELIARLLTADLSLVMPPPETKKKLSSEDKEKLGRWIADGAEYQPHWSLIPPAKSEVPTPSHVAWPKNAIDHFVLSKLEQAGLAPAPEADPRTLFRRLHLDITGLPPAHKDTEAFAAAYVASPDETLSQWIDRLMETPAYGEHRARFWLDAARYADTHGLHFDNYREMWPYRDWVIRAFNANQPFDQFTVEQLAGDLLPSPTDEQLIATGFQRCNITTNEGGTIDEENLALYAADRVQTFGWVYMGLTTNCSQCHDHKFDPISIKDYYSLAAYFRNTTQKAKDGNVKDGLGPAMVVPMPEDVARWKALPSEVAAAIAARDDRKATARPAFEQWAAMADPHKLGEISAEQLLVHLPLNQGAGSLVTKAPATDAPVAEAPVAEAPASQVQSAPAPVAQVAVAQVAVDQVAVDQVAVDQVAVDQVAVDQVAVDQVAVDQVAATQAQIAPVSAAAPAVVATGEIAWIAEGKLGPAAILKKGSTLELGDQGNFEKDQSFSYAAWVRTSDDGAMGGIVARMDEADNYRGWDLWQQGRSVCVHIVDSWPQNALKVTTREPVLKSGEWRHVLATYDGSGKIEGIKLYVDGKLQAVNAEQSSLKPDATIRTSTPLRIGQRSGEQVFEGGSVQDFRLYHRVLNESEADGLAKLVPLQALLKVAAESRTTEQQTALYEHYLAHEDSTYLSLARVVTEREAELAAIRGRSPVTHIQQERPDAMPMANILMRGEYDKLGEEVVAAPPAAFHPLPAGAPNNRLGLAQWVVDPANPLTARVTVNRFWQEIFGRGLVATPEDFGIMGAIPSHPELLDWLAVDFREHGWNVKALFKQMLMSASYRQAAIVTPEKLELDRDNVWLSRGPRFRMAAEMIRDYALASSGLLSDKMYGPGVKPYQPGDIWNIVGLPGGDTREYALSEGENLFRRSLYTFWKRMAPPPNLEAFNAPSREVCTVQRERTNTPLQALVSLNDPMFVEAARKLAEQALVKADGQDTNVLAFISAQALGRPFNDLEVEVLLEDKQAFLEHYRATPDDAQALVAIGTSPIAEGNDKSLLAAWTMVCNQVLNLDEVLNK